MDPRYRLLTALFLLTSAAAAACGPETVRVTPAPSVAPTTAAPTATPTRTPAPSPVGTPAPPTTAPPTPTPTAPASPGSTPATACPAQTGGSTANRAVLTDTRVAHHPGFDRLVFELAPSSGPGAYGVPPYKIEVASTFTAVSGQPVRVQGNAFFQVLFQNADAHNDAGKSTISVFDFKPGTPLIREVSLVEDFEATVRWAVGLDHLACPTVSTLAGPVRVVLDFPTPP